MNFASPTTFEMGLDEIMPESCYNCSNDCMGIIEHIFKRIEDDNHANFLINSILVEDKGYYSANYSSTFYNGRFEKCITLYNNEASKFSHNMIKLGYQIFFARNKAKNYLTDVIIKKDNLVKDPKNLIYIFRQLEEI